MRPRRTSVNPQSLSIIGIPKHLQDKTVDDIYDTDDKEAAKKFVEEYLDSFEDNVRQGRGILLCGSNGVGKTMIACILLKEAYMRRYSCSRVTFANYISYYAASWDKRGDDKEELEQEVFEKYKSAEFLVIEEIGKEIDSKIAKPILEDLLRYREEQGLVTIICTNMSVKEIKKDYGSSILSIMQGTMTPIVIVGQDNRANEFKKGVLNESDKDRKKR